MTVQPRPPSLPRRLEMYHPTLKQLGIPSKRFKECLVQFSFRPLPSNRFPIYKSRLVELFSRGWHHLQQVLLHLCLKRLGLIVPIIMPVAFSGSWFQSGTAASSKLLPIDWVQPKKQCFFAKRKTPPFRNTLSGGNHRCINSSVWERGKCIF